MMGQGWLLGPHVPDEIITERSCDCVRSHSVKGRANFGKDGVF